MRQHVIEHQERNCGTLEGSQAETNVCMLCACMAARRREPLMWSDPLMLHLASWCGEPQGLSSGHLW